MQLSVLMGFLALAHELRIRPRVVLIRHLASARGALRSKELSTYTTGWNWCQHNLHAIAFIQRSRYGFLVANSSFTECAYRE